MRKPKAINCSKEEAEKDLKERMWKDEFIITFHIWADYTTGTELYSKWDLDKATDYFIDWFRYGCISSLLWIWQELLGDDFATTAQIIKDFLEQLHYNVKDEFWTTDKEEYINKFAEMFRKSVNESED